METNILRVLILIVLFFLLTCEYSTFIKKLLSDDSSDIEVINKPKAISRRSKEKSYDEISLSDVINEEEEEDNEDEDEDIESNKEFRRSKCKC